MKPIFSPDQDVVLEGLVDIKSVLPEVAVNLKYASSDNFVRWNFYGGLKHCYFTALTAQMLAEAYSWLKERDDNLNFLIFDGARPLRAQRIMYAKVKDTPHQVYVANPDGDPGSMHTYGCAVDLTLYEKGSGETLDMGSPFDFFGELAEPQLEIKLWREGQLTSEQWANRLLLREVMLRAGFLPLAHEWWHFNCMKPSEVKSKFKQIP